MTMEKHIEKIILTLLFSVVFQMTIFDAELFADSQKFDTITFISSKSDVHSGGAALNFIAIADDNNYFHTDKILCGNNGIQPVKVVCFLIKDFQYRPVNRMSISQFPLRC